MEIRSEPYGDHISKGVIDELQALASKRLRWVDEAKDEAAILREALEEIAELGDVRADEAGVIAQIALEKARQRSPLSTR